MNISEITGDETPTFEIDASNWSAVTINELRESANQSPNGDMKVTVNFPDNTRNTMTTLDRVNLIAIVVEALALGLDNVKIGPEKIDLVKAEVKFAIFDLGAVVIRGKLYDVRYDFNLCFFKRDGFFDSQTDMFTIEREVTDTLSGAEIDTLVALVEQGPLQDGDVPSKTGRNGLIDAGLAVRVLVKGEDDYTAATYQGRDVYKKLFGTTPGEAADTVVEAKANRIAQRILRNG